MRRLTALFGFFALLAIAVISIVPVVRITWLAAGLAFATSVVWLGFGLSIVLDKSRRWLGTVVLVLGGLWPLQFLVMWEAGPAEFIGTVGTGAFWVVGALLGFTILPDYALTRAEKIFIGAYGAYTGLTLPTVMLVSQPEWMGFDADTWWVTVATNRAMFDAITGFWPIGDSVASVSVVALMTLRIRRMASLDRADVTLMLVSFVVMAVYSSVRSIQVAGQWYATSPSQLVPLGLTGLFTALGLANVEWRRRNRDRQMTLVLQQQLRSQSGSLDQVENVLRLVLRDPRVTLRAPEQADRASDLAIPVQSANDETLAIIDGAAYLKRHKGTLHVVAEACAVALENARLRDLAEQRQREAEEALLHAQESAAALGRLERNLHDDLQQRLLALRMRLGMLGSGAGDEIHDALDALGRDIGTALEAVRKMVHGEEPPELKQLGLKAALEVRAQFLPFDVSMTLPDGLPQRLQSTVYFIVCESLNNAAKHAAASNVAVKVVLDADEVAVEVTDDGTGIPESANGFGLLGIRKRVEDLGGVLELSRLSAGTQVKAVMPCV